MVDFDRRSIGSETSAFNSGFIIADCALKGGPPGAGNSPFVGASQYNDGASVPVDRIEKNPTYFATRDDCGNMWHDSADLLRTSVMQQLLKLDTKAMQGVILDTRLMCHGQRLDQALKEHYLYFLV